MEPVEDMDSSIGGGGRMEIREFIEQTARGAGEIVLSHFGQVKSKRSKGDRGDIVTEVDIESERYIIGRVRKAYPSHGILSEEAGRIGDEDAEYMWLIDPLDGTRNYSLGIPIFAVSIALIRDGRAEYGAVYDPRHDELFSAARGQGTTLNHTPIRMTVDGNMDDALIAVSWLRRRVKQSQFVGYMDRVSQRTSYFRRLGSAAIDCCYVASGRLDAYMQGAINCWDVAAGSLLVEEAGGLVTDFEGKPLDLSRPATDILAANPAMHARILEEIIGG